MLLLTHIPSLKLPLLHTTLGPYGVRAPDLTLLLTTEFWGPMLAYALPGLLLPALAGYLCNFTAKKAARSSWTKSLVPEERRVRRLGANASGAERAKHRVDVGNELAVRSQFVYGVDPLVFGLVRAGMVWAAMERRVAGDHLGLVNLERARAGLMGGTGGVVLGSLAVVVCVVYETILRA